MWCGVVWCGVVCIRVLYVCVCVCECVREKECASVYVCGVVCVSE